MRLLKRYFLLLLAVSLILGVSYTSPASAIDLSQDVDYKEVVNGALYYRVFNGSSWGSFNNGGTYTMGASERLTALQFRNKANSLPADTNTGDFFTLGMWVQFDGTGSHWNTSGYYYMTETTDGVTCPILDIDANTIQNFNDNSGNTSQRHLLFITCKVTSASPSSIGINLGLRSVSSGMRFSPITYSHWRKSSNSVVDEITAVKNAVNNMSSAIQNKLNVTNQKLDTLNISVNDLKAAQEQANQDANDRYQDEKDTINNNASDAQNQANNAQFGFSVGNPLTTWLGLFTGSNCVDIPTIASWIHSNETRVCSPWASNIRDVTTPIISVLSGTILFGFIVKWLNGSSFNESIEVG